MIVATIGVQVDPSVLYYSSYEIIKRPVPPAAAPVGIDHVSGISVVVTEAETIDGGDILAGTS